MLRYKRDDFINKHYLIIKDLLKQPDFDVLANDPEDSANIIKNKLENNGFKDIKIHR